MFVVFALVLHFFYSRHQAFLFSANYIAAATLVLGVVCSARFGRVAGILFSLPPWPLPRSM
jgi:hypothetical protein